LVGRDRIRKEKGDIHENEKGTFNDSLAETVDVPEWALQDLNL
jgi:hypothetical protein